MPDVLMQIVEQFGTLLKLREQLTTLSNDRPLVAGVLIFLMIIVATKIIVSQLIDFFRTFGSWARRPVVVLPLILGLSVAGLASAGLVLDLRRNSQSVPIIEIDSDTVIGPTLNLRWKYDKTAPRYQVQSAVNKTFSIGAREEGYTDGVFIPKDHVNAARYWRVRAVGLDNAPSSDWSASILATQYDSSFNRISETGRLRVNVSNSHNQGAFKFLKGGVYAGYEIDLITEIVAALPQQLNLGRKVDFSPEPIPWANLLDAPQRGRADLIVATISARKDREEKHRLRFTQPYYCTTLSVVFRPSTRTRPIREMLGGRSVAVQEGTTSEIYIEALNRDMKGNAPAKIIRQPESRSVIDLVVSGGADFAITDTPFASADQMARGAHLIRLLELTSPDDFSDDTPFEGRVDYYAIGLRDTEQELLDAINKSIQSMRARRLGELIDEANKTYARHMQLSEAMEAIPNRPDPTVCPAN